MLGLLSACQHDFPLVARPFDAIAREKGRTEDEVLEALRDWRASGALSRIGAVWERGAGGAGALCALRVAPADLERVAGIVNREPCVNHNYERDHAWNLWYVITAGDAARVREVARRIERAAGMRALFLPMVRAYRIDLGFDLHEPLARRHAVKVENPPPVGEADRPLAALAEEGLALVERPFDLWAAELGRSTAQVLETLQKWKAAGTMRRFGIVVRHHDVGFASNAMTVVRAPAEDAQAIGAALAKQPGVTLCYQRDTDPRWPYNLYFMVHGRERHAVETLVANALEAAGASQLRHETLFSIRRFKQTGSRYFSEAPA